VVPASGLVVAYGFAHAPVEIGLGKEPGEVVPGPPFPGFPGSPPGRSVFAFIRRRSHRALSDLGAQGLKSGNDLGRVRVSGERLRDDLWLPHPDGVLGKGALFRDHQGWRWLWNVHDSLTGFSVGMILACHRVAANRRALAWRTKLGHDAGRTICRASGPMLYSFGCVCMWMEGA